MASAPFDMSALMGSTEMMAANGQHPIRPSVLGAHQMPEPSRVPWNSDQMPWTSVAPNGVVQFKGGDIMGSAPANMFVQMRVKRKAVNDVPSMDSVPIPKRLITDDHMAEHLNSMHISSDFTPHHLQPSTSAAVDSDTGFEHMADYSSTFFENRTHNVPMTTKDLQQKLRNAQRITICDEIRRIQSEPLLPGSLLQRIERPMHPCTALVLWQPPAKIVDPTVSAMPEGNNNDENDGAHGIDVNYLDEGIEDDYGLDNNNSSNIDLNSSMDLDL